MQAERAAELLRHRAPEVVALVEHQEAVLQVSDFLMRAVDLDGVREAREQRHHARAVLRQVVGAVHHDVQAARAARGEELAQLLDALRRIEAQRRQVRIEDAQFAPLRGEQAIEGLLEIRLSVELQVLSLRRCFAQVFGSGCRNPARYHS